MGNAVTTGWRWIKPLFAAANQARFEDTACAVQRLLKFVAADGVERFNIDFPGLSGFVATALKKHHNLWKWGAKRPDLS
jgi:hypothetical protein